MRTRPPASRTPAPDELGTPPVPASEAAARRNEARLSTISEVSAGSCCCFFLPGLLLLAWFFGFNKKKRDAQRAAAQAGRTALATASYDEVRRISIGFDWSVRRTLQGTLDQMADTLAMDSTADRQRAAGLMADAFEAAAGGARYFCYQSLRTVGADTESTFARLTHDLAARYQHERGHGGELRAHRHEGDGLVVVSLLLATSTAMPLLPRANDPRALSAAVDGLRRILSPEVFAMEVIWSPAEELDRMSSLELEGLYPELQRLDDQVALGRVSCGYCQAPFPGELGRCPACGAPVTASAPSV